MYKVIVKVFENGAKDAKFLKYRNVRHLNKLIEYLESKGYTVDYLNVYSQKTLEKIYAGNRKQLQNGVEL
jgi:hypothetical protein